MEVYISWGNVWETANILNSIFSRKEEKLGIQKGKED